MSEERTESRGPDLDVDALFDESDDELESGATLANARASAALAGSVPDPSLADLSFEDETVSLTSAPSALGLPLPRDMQETLLDLDREANLPAVLSTGALPLPARPSFRPPPFRASEPAPPMAVPSLRPPVAAPPPIRASQPPPVRALANAQLTGTEPTPRAPRSLPPLAPPPTLPWRGETEASVFSAPSSPEVRSSAALASRRDPAPFAAHGIAQHGVAAHGVAAAAATPTGTLLGPYRPSAPIVHPVPTMRQPQASSTTLQGVGPTETKDAAPDLELAPQAQPIDPEPHRASPNRVWLWLALITLAVGTALVLWRMSPNPPGDLVVSVAGPSSQAIPKLELLVDDELRCTYSPCRISGLSEGVHVLRARAPGYVESAPRPLLMASGTDLTQNLVLSPVPARASLSISARGTNLTITVDDEERGAPPVEVSDLEPGEHRIVVSGPRFEALTERVVLGPGERRGLGPFAPKVKTGSLSVRLGANAEGASVELDGQPLRSLPHQAELAANRPHTLRAEKTGFDRFEREIVFPDGKAELDVEIVLLEAAGDEAQQESTTPASADASAPAVLSMNSIPASKITLDGKALGSTPRRGVKVRAGQHQIVFVHPQRGKKSVSIRVRPGEKRNVSVRF